MVAVGVAVVVTLAAAAGPWSAHAGSWSAPSAHAGSRSAHAGPWSAHAGPLRARGSAAPAGPGAPVPPAGSATPAPPAPPAGSATSAPPAPPADSATSAPPAPPLGSAIPAPPAPPAGSAIPASPAPPDPAAGSELPAGPVPRPGPALPDAAGTAVTSVAPPAPPRPAGAGIPAPGARYAWPLHPPPVVTGAFRAPTFRYGPGHRGADLAGGPGQAVLAAREGTVVFAGPVAGRGVVSVDHPDGLRSTYEPVTATVAAGTVVAPGDPLGVLEAGHPGCPVAACLHWGVRRDRLDHLDPLVLLRPPRVRLLPWAGAAPG